MKYLGKVIKIKDHNFLVYSYSAESLDLPYKIVYLGLDTVSVIDSFRDKQVFIRDLSEILDEIYSKKYGYKYNSSDFDFVKRFFDFIKRDFVGIMWFSIEDIETMATEMDKSFIISTFPKTVTLFDFDYE